MSGFHQIPQFLPRNYLVCLNWIELVSATCNHKALDLRPHLSSSSFGNLPQISVPYLHKSGFVLASPLTGSVEDGAHCWMSNFAGSKANFACPLSFTGGD